MRPRSPNGGRAQPDSRRAPRAPRRTAPAVRWPTGAIRPGAIRRRRSPAGAGRGPGCAECRGTAARSGSNGRRTAGHGRVGARLSARGRYGAVRKRRRARRDAHVRKGGTAHGGRNDLHRRGGAHGCARHGDTVLGRLGIGRGRPGRLVVGRRRGRRLLVLRRRFVLRRRLVLRWRWWWRLRWRGWRRRLLSHRAGGRRPAGTWGPGVVPRPGGPLISRPTRGSWSPFTRPSGRTPVLFHAYGMEIWTSWVKALRTATIS